ncbi:hypothetical protein [Spirosoma validum]|uniref:Uncharacterized protein n=1 Tax=Spirosoma validum TaxID=2771355 RepID=A0A927GHD7_9BACT|nr:hypothetical protein [Spirosoma validum]MBD2757613.1 hypothetical protein [Spirosoma validum]
MTTLEKETIKQALRELIHEDKDLFKAMLREILEEDSKPSVSDRQAKVDAIIQRDFERYKNVFKALA